MEPVQSAPPTTSDPYDAADTAATLTIARSAPRNVRAEPTSTGVR